MKPASTTTSGACASRPRRRAAPRPRGPGGRRTARRPWRSPPSAPVETAPARGVGPHDDRLAGERVDATASSSAAVGPDPETSTAIRLGAAPVAGDDGAPDGDTGRLLDGASRRGGRAAAARTLRRPRPLPRARRRPRPPGEGAVTPVTWGAQVPLTSYGRPPPCASRRAMRVPPTGATTPLLSARHVTHAPGVRAPARRRRDPPLARAGALPPAATVPRSPCVSVGT